MRPRPDGPALVLTADVIAPIVDDPATFGRIAAANSLSDVYAMGGRPLYALNLMFFPDEALPREVMLAILRGAAEACAEAGVAIVGGHTVRDAELKFGLSVTGEVEVDRVLSNRGARAGQRLVLTKALGTGVVGTAIKRGVATAEEIEAASASMGALNAAALAVARRFPVSACTDVTGFGLLGHLRNILRGSDLAARIELGALPLLPGARAHATAGLVPGGSKANLEFMQDALRGAEAADPVLVSLAADAQTSGGLLLCVDGSAADELAAALVADGLPARVVGELVPPSADRAAGTIELN